MLGDYMKIVIEKRGLTPAREEMKIWWWGLLGEIFQLLVGVSLFSI